MHQSRETRQVDQVVLECGTLPNEELYFELQEAWTNQGCFDLEAFAKGELVPEYMKSGRSL